MRRLLSVTILGLATIAMTHLASAADIPVKAPVKNVAPPPYNWGGFYVGAHVGYLWGSSTVVDNGVVAESDAPTNGAVGGVLGGYNWQLGAFVFGVDGDFGWTNAHGNGQAAPSPPPTESFLYDAKWTSHVRGRVGYATGPWLLFAAGGVAITDFDVTMLTTNSIVAMTCGGTYTGWSIGGGAEYAFNNRISGRVEYLYDNFGTKTYVMGPNDAYDAHLTGSTVRGALVIKLGQ